MSQPKSVAKISEATAIALEVDIVLDADNNIVVDLSFGFDLEVTEFDAIPFAPSTLPQYDGITPPKRHIK